MSAIRVANLPSGTGVCDCGACDGDVVEVVVDSVDVDGAERAERVGCVAAPTSTRCQAREYARRV